MVDFSVIAVPPLPIMKMIHPATLNRHLNTPTWDAFGEIKNIELDNLPTVVIGDTDVWENYVGHVSLSGALAPGSPNLPTVVIGDTDVWENYVGHVSLSGAISSGWSLWW